LDFLVHMLYVWQFRNRGSKVLRYGFRRRCHEDIRVHVKRRHRHGRRCNTGVPHRSRSPIDHRWDDCLDVGHPGGSGGGFSDWSWYTIQPSGPESREGQNKYLSRARTCEALDGRGVPGCSRLAQPPQRVHILDPCLCDIDLDYNCLGPAVPAVSGRRSWLEGGQPEQTPSLSCQSVAERDATEDPGGLLSRASWWWPLAAERVSLPGWCRQSVRQHYCSWRIAGCCSSSMTVSVRPQRKQNPDFRISCM